MKIYVIALILGALVSLSVTDAQASTTLTPSVVRGARPDLCEYEKCGSSSAAEWAELYASVHWGSYGSATTEYCTGEYEKAPGRTQWACYGRINNNSLECRKWQENVDENGNETYHFGLFCKE